MIPRTDLSVGPDPDRYFGVDPAVTDSKIPRVISLQKGVRRSFIKRSEPRYPFVAYLAALSGCFPSPENHPSAISVEGLIAVCMTDHVSSQLQ